LRVERERELALRLLELRGFALLVERFAAERFAAGFVAVDDRLLSADVFARLVLVFFAVLRFAVERLVDDLRAPPLRDEPDEEPELALALPSIVHLPVITR
jgi:hypothetical protein